MLLLLLYFFLPKNCHWTECEVQEWDWQSIVFSGYKLPTLTSGQVQDWADISVSQSID